MGTTQGLRKDQHLDPGVPLLDLPLAWAAMNQTGISRGASGSTRGHTHTHEGVPGASYELEHGMGVVSGQKVWGRLSHSCSRKKGVLWHGFRS